MPRVSRINQIHCLYADFWSFIDQRKVSQRSMIILWYIWGTAVELPLPNMQVFIHEYPVPNDGKNGSSSI
jgi:hypothetical protein